jgi:hypothetical protein
MAPATPSARRRLVSSLNPKAGGRRAPRACGSVRDGEAARLRRGPLPQTSRPDTGRTMRRHGPYSVGRDVDERTGDHAKVTTSLGRRRPTMPAANLWRPAHQGRRARAHHAIATGSLVRPPPPPTYGRGGAQAHTTPETIAGGQQRQPPLGSCRVLRSSDGRRPRARRTRCCQGRDAVARRADGIPSLASAVPMRS